MKIRFFKISICIFLWIIAASCEVIVGGAILNSHQNSTSFLFLALPIHILASILSFLVFWIYSLEKRNELKFYSYLCGLMTLFLSLIGILGVTISFLLVKFILKKKGYFTTTDDPLENIDGESLLFENTTDTNTLLKEETNIEPILDIINGDDPALKRGAINLLREIGSKEAIHLLKKSISDSNEEVRFYTSAALKKLNDAYIQHIKKAKEKVEGEKPLSFNYQNLGKVYKKYAESGLCDQSARDFYLDLAREAFIEALSLDPENIETATNLGYVCMEMKDYEEAEKYFKIATNIKPDYADALLWLCQLYYEKWDLKALVENIQGMNPKDLSEIKDQDNRMLLKFWAKKDKVFSDG
jgi:polysaccharide biosynthesis protein PelE